MMREEQKLQIQLQEFLGDNVGLNLGKCTDTDSPVGGHTQLYLASARENGRPLIKPSRCLGKRNKNDSRR